MGAVLIERGWMIGTSRRTRCAVVVLAAVALSHGPPSVLAGDPPVTCVTCHAQEGSKFATSVHHSLSRCQDCHGGEDAYGLAPGQVEPYSSAGRSALLFDHGATFLGKPARADVPELCGKCHSDVERMNPYGLRTDQLARYWTSGHGKTLKTKGDDRVAVCIDCHGAHEIRTGHEPESRTHPLNVPSTCASCHGNAKLMADFGLSVAQVDEYRQSVHGKLLFEQQDTGAPTCATCHGNHSAMPPGFADVRAVCGQCHRDADEQFATSVHASLPEHKGCVQCHGGGEGRHFHLIRRITKGPSFMIQQYTQLLSSEPAPSTERISETIHPAPKQIIEQALPTCMECHEDIEDDESLPVLFQLLDEIAKAEEHYVRTGRYLEQLGQGVLLVDNQRIKFLDAKTHLISLAPLQHTLDNSKVAAKVAELNAVCDEVESELAALEEGLRWRHRALIPIWIFATLFAAALYAKFKQLKRAYVKPLPPSGESH